MKKIYLLSILVAGLMALNACMGDNVFVETDDNGDEVITDVLVSADAFVPQTRSMVSNKLLFTWASNDIIGVFPGPEKGDDSPSSQVMFKTSSGGAETAKFTGSGWGLIPLRKYYAYYPYTSTATDTLVKFTYKPSAIQKENDGTSQLGVNDLMYSSATTPGPGNTAQFQFHHLGSIMKIEITVPNESAGKKFTKVIVECADSIFPEVVSFNPTADVIKDSVETFTNRLDLTLSSDDKGFAPVDGKLSVWFMVGAADFTGKTLKVSTFDGRNALSGTFDGAEQKAGRAHLYTASVTRTNPENTVDLGLPSGKLWALTNLTASGLAASETALGDYYSWGELTPYYSSATISGETLTATWKDGYSAGYTEDNYNKGGIINGTYTTNGAQLQKEDDAAYVTLGGNWRMPSIADADELNANCTISSATLNGASGILMTSKINGNSIFFVCNGYIEGNSKVSGYVSGSKGPRFWLTDCYSSTKAYQQLINMTSNNKFDHDSSKSKWRATPIRPIYVP